VRPVTRNELAAHQLCWLTTRGRLSGAARTVEMWFALHGDTVYFLAGGRDRSHWVQNLLVHPRATVRVGETRLRGDARVLEPGDEDALARRLLVEKYQSGYAGDLTEWGRTSLPVALDLDPVEEPGAAV
jgi:deazaflavin-dependent oxidoreductase (nitroreductase family)